MDGIVSVCCGTDGSYLLDAPPELHDTLPGRLERYIIADDVIMEDVGLDWDLFHFTGTTLPALPATAHCLHHARLGVPGHDVWLPASESAAFRKATVFAGEAQWDALRIAAGMPRWGRELTRDTLPPEAKLEELAIDYAKGCYIGQEVISRMKTAGKVNRLLCRWKHVSGPAPQAPTFLWAPDGREAGLLTSAAGGFCLGFLKREFQGSQEVLAGADATLANSRLHLA
jgi:folate-binding protein YgfZ